MTRQDTTANATRADLRRAIIRTAARTHWLHNFTNRTPQLTKASSAAAGLSAGAPACKWGSGAFSDSPFHSINHNQNGAR